MFNFVKKEKKILIELLLGSVIIIFIVNCTWRELKMNHAKMLARLKKVTTNKN